MEGRGGQGTKDGVAVITRKWSTHQCVLHSIHKFLDENASQIVGDSLLVVICYQGICTVCQFEK